jgi:hypothetical protein
MIDTDPLRNGKKDVLTGPSGPARQTACIIAPGLIPLSSHLSSAWKTAWSLSGVKNTSPQNTVGRCLWHWSSNCVTTPKLQPAPRIAQKSYTGSAGAQIARRAYRTEPQLGLGPAALQRQYRLGERDI